MAIEVLEIGHEGLIVKNDEYHSTRFDEGVDVGRDRKLPMLPSDL